MVDYRERFKSCGEKVTLADDVYIEAPEVMEVGDNVTFMRGFNMTGTADVCRIGTGCLFSPNCVVELAGGHLELEDRVTFYPGNYISMGRADTCRLHVGHDSHFAPGCILYGTGGLSFGAYNAVAAHTVFATVGYYPAIHDHPMVQSGVKMGPITLEDDVWVCANVTITSDTRVAKGCIVAANAVVTKDTEPYGVYAGVPAVRIRDREDKRETVE